MAERLRFRNPDLAKRVTTKISLLSKGRGNIRICHVCGTHEWTITHYGLRSLLPENVEVIAGPGCPVCIVPASEIDEAVQLALRGIIVVCFGDLLRVPGSKLSLLDAKAKGADVRVVYSVGDAVKISLEETARELVFFAVGFETTSPSTAVEILSKPPENMSFLVSHRLIPPAMKMLVEKRNLNLNGFIAPGHVSTIIGMNPYKAFPKTYGIPVVVAGFEPLDVLISIYMIMKQLNNNKPALENEYVRAVKPEGNLKAKRIIQDTFEIANGKWRGLGIIPSSRLNLKKQYKKFDAHLRYSVKIEDAVDLKPDCRCHLVVTGEIKPTECPLFMKECTPRKPVGACMVSTEGTCRIWTTALPS